MSDDRVNLCCGHAACQRLVAEAKAEAWDEGRRAERRDWELLYDLVTPDEERQPLPNPYRGTDAPK